MDSKRFVNLEQIIDEFSLEVLDSSWWDIFSTLIPIGSS